jgi:hypothetical protein
MWSGKSLLVLQHRPAVNLDVRMARSAVDLRWNELVFNVDTGHKLLERSGCLIIESL